MQALSLVTLMVCIALASISGEPQFPNHPYPAAYPANQFGNNYFRSDAQEGRFFLGTRTLVITTSTTTRTITSTTTCTTSTAALSTCVASGGRRRRNFGGRGLFYEEGNEESILLPSANKPEEMEKEVEPVRSTRDTNVVEVPFVVQPGFSVPNGVTPRFLLAFSTSIITATTTMTTTTSMVAICSSISNFQLCGSSGK